jgi:hypothetical protein
MGMEEQSATDGIRATALTIAPDEVLLSLATDQISVKYGSFINLTGQANLKDKTTLSSLPLNLEFKGSDETTWRQIYKPVTSETGAFATLIYLAKSGKLRITSEVSWERGAGLSSEISVTVNPRVNIVAPTSAKAGTAFKMTVSVAPATAGTQVALRRLDGKVWNTVSLVPLLATGAELSQVELSRGIYSYQVLVFNSADSTESTSPPFTVVVR